jgi:hypothetical protein
MHWEILWLIIAKLCYYLLKKLIIKKSVKLSNKDKVKRRTVFSTFGIPTNQSSLTLKFSSYSASDAKAINIGMALPAEL